MLEGLLAAQSKVDNLHNAVFGNAEVVLCEVNNGQSSEKWGMVAYRVDISMNDIQGMHEGQAVGELAYLNRNELVFRP